MPIIRGRNGRRHEVDFGDAPVRVEVYAGEETVATDRDPAHRVCPCRNRSRDNRRTLIAQRIERLNALSKTARRADVRPLSR
jgi:hypothetical protein